MTSTVWFRLESSNSKTESGVVVAKGRGEWGVGSYCLMGVEFQFCKMERVLEMVVMIASQCKCKINDYFRIPNLVMQFQWKLVFYISFPPPSLVTPAKWPDLIYFLQQHAFHSRVSACAASHRSHFLSFAQNLSPLIATCVVPSKLLITSQTPSQVSVSLPDYIGYNDYIKILFGLL